MGEGVAAGPDWDLANQSPPDYPDDQRYYLVTPTTVATPPPGRGCVCGSPLALTVVTAAQILGESDWRLGFLRPNLGSILGLNRLEFLSLNYYRQLANQASTVEAWLEPNSLPGTRWIQRSPIERQKCNQQTLNFSSNPIRTTRALTAASPKRQVWFMSLGTAPLMTQNLAFFAVIRRKKKYTTR